MPQQVAGRADSQVSDRPWPGAHGADPTSEDGMYVGWHPGEHSTAKATLSSGCWPSGPVSVMMRPWSASHPPRSLLEATLSLPGLVSGQREEGGKGLLFPSLLSDRPHTFLCNFHGPGLGLQSAYTDTSFARPHLQESWCFQPGTPQARPPLSPPVRRGPSQGALALGTGDKGS